MFHVLDWKRFGAVAVALIACFALLAGADQPQKVRRFGQVIRVKPEKLDYYKELHAKPWPSILKTLTESNIHNYSIFLKQLDDDNYYLFAYFEYTGADYEADMKKIADDPETKRWWLETDPCQIPVKHREEGQWWTPMESVFYHP
jgi:L-rhamnose mutarotase